MNTLLCKSNKPENKRKTKKKKKGKASNLDSNVQIMRPEKQKSGFSDSTNPKVHDPNSSSTDGQSSLEFGTDRDQFSIGGSLPNRHGSDATQGISAQERGNSLYA